MGFFHVGERFCAAPQHVRRVLMLDFPDERFSPGHPVPNPSDDNAIFLIDVDVSAHATSNLCVRIRQGQRVERGGDY
jgi:hypothetical protein